MSANAKPPLVDQPSPLPTRKVAAGAIGAALATIVVWALNTYTHVVLPDYVAGAIATLIGGVAAYFTRERGVPPSEENT